MFGEETIVRNLFHSQTKQDSYISQNDCEYCHIKQKHSVGGENKRCLLHSISRAHSDESHHSGNSQQPNIIGDTLRLLEEVEENIQEYWNHLHQYSLGNVGKVRSDLIPIFEAVERIEEKLSRFPTKSQTGGNFEIDMKRTKDIYDLQDKKMGTKSERYITSNFSELQDTSPKQQIKQWVMHYHKIITGRQINDEILPYDQELDMRIFKESMEKKFIVFARNYEKYEKRVGQTLQKLLYYMQNCGQTVSSQILKQDLNFIEGCDYSRHILPAEDDRHLLILQAVSLQQLLAEKQIVQFQQQL